ncbi:MAG: peptidylprolyl isomerase [Deltaproteobacteria bacterium]|nr:peptidylprolyl isomerase [Deltaproteobacteria bacterium]
MAALLVAASFACGRGGDKGTVVVARVGPRAITLKEYEDALARLAPSGASEGKDDLALLKRDLINQMIEDALILGEAERLSITVSGDELYAEVEGVKKDYGDAFKDAIAERYGDVNAWKAELRKKLIIRKTIAKAAVSKKPPSGDAARKYYDGHLKEFDAPEQVKARMIVVASEDDAGKIKKTLTPENFSKTAREVSLTPEGKNGGDLGYFGRGDMPKEFEDAVFGLSIGGISPVVKTEYGYHIFLLEARKKDGRLKWEEARPRIIERMRLEDADAEYGRWVEGLKAKGKIEINEALL